LKADFIASLPMQPSGCPCYLFSTLLRDVVLCSEMDQAEECYHIHCD
jgi:hypothetical protein